MQFKTLSYSGNGADNRSITGVGFQPDVVIIKREDTGNAVWRGAQVGDVTSYFRAIADGADLIQALEADGFQVGTSTTVNGNTATHHAVCFKDNGSGARIKVGTYTGNGVDNRSITGVGFQPDLVWVKKTTAVQGCWRCNLDSGDDTHDFYPGAADAVDKIQAFEADGFQVGTHDEVNTDTATYWYVAMKLDPDVSMDTLSYTGNGLDNRSITGLGLQPAYAWVKSDGALGKQAVHKPDTLAGDLTLFFQTGIAATANYIQALEADGIQVGTNTIVNQDTQAYHLVAWKVPPVVEGHPTMRRWEQVPYMAHTRRGY